MSNKLVGGITATGLIGSVIAANWLTTRYGFIPVGFGLASTAGTFAAGFAIALRDATQDLLGKKMMLAVVAVGAAISYLIADPMIAIASAAAFALAELVNFTIYTPLRERSKLGDRTWFAAVIASNLGAAIADTVVFLWIAFGWAAVVPALAGQLVGKGWATLAYLAAGKGAAWFSTSRTPAVVNVSVTQ